MARGAAQDGNVEGLGLSPVLLVEGDHVIGDAMVCALAEAGTEAIGSAAKP